MNLITYMVDNASRLLLLTEQHVELVLISVAISAVVGIGLALATESSPGLSQVLMSLTGTLLTVPSYAMFALMIPVFGLGVAPTIVALAIYGVFPILRNTVTGIDGVDPAIIDAARGLGMSRRLRLRTVVLPLAWPVILNGIRTATIMLVATAAIGAIVRGPGLGELIFRGLARIGGANALEEALSGVIGVVVVALVLDLVFVVIARVTTVRGLNV
jgi:osmoprotectant transport system permease protein